MALSYHETTHRYQQRGSDSELFRAQQSGDDDIASRFDSAVCAQTHLVAKAVDGQHLVHFCQADLPGQPCILDRRLRRCARSAAVS